MHTRNDLTRLLSDIANKVNLQKDYSASSDYRSGLATKCVTMAYFVAVNGTEQLGPIDCNRYYNFFKHDLEGAFPTDNREMDIYLRELHRNLWKVVEDVCDSRTYTARAVA